MTADQYRHLRENLRSDPPRALGDVSRRSRAKQDATGKRARSTLEGEFAALRTQARRRNKVLDVWQKVTDPRWSDEVQVVGFARENLGELVIWARTATAYYEVTRRKAILERDLIQLVPGMRNLRVVRRQTTNSD